MIDRGLKNATQTETWNKICQNIVVTLAQKEYLRAVIGGVNEIGQVLDQYYVKTDLYEENELPNEPIILN